jgi:hypothetical protein
LAVAAMAFALASMLLCLLWPTRWPLAIFMGPGLACGVGGLSVFLWYVVQDLRRRRVL